MAEKWIQKAKEKMEKKGTVGLLHKKTHTPMGKNIPESKLGVKKGDSTKTKREKIFAQNVKKK